MTAGDVFISYPISSAIEYKHQLYFTPFYGYQGEEECDQPPTHQQQSSAEASCGIPGEYGPGTCPQQTGESSEPHLEKSRKELAATELGSSPVLTLCTECELG